MSVEWNGDCPEEKVAHGDLGTVKDEEDLARFVWLDRDFVENNRINTNAIQVEEFWKKKEGEDGWSLSRQKHIKDMEEELRQRSKGKGLHCGYVSVKAGDIRRILDREGERAVCVIDNPVEKIPEHALAKRARSYTRAKARIIRDEFLQKFSEVKSITEKK